MSEPEAERQSVPSTPSPVASGADDEASHRLPALLWGLVGTGFCLLVRHLEPSLLEEGYLVHFAERMAAGEVLYRNLVTFTGPLPFELLAAVYRVTGASVDVARTLAALFAGLGTACAYVLAARSRAGVFAHLAAAWVAVAPLLLFPLLALYFYSTLALHLALATAAAAALGLHSSRWAITAGALLSLTALCKQPVGVVLAPLLFLALLLAAPSHGARRAASLVVGALAVAALALLVPLWRGDLSLWIEWLVWIPISLEVGLSSPLPNFWPPGVFEARIAAEQSFYLPHLHLLLGGDGRAPAPVFVFLTQIAFALPFLALGVFAVGALLRALGAGSLPVGALAVQAALVAALASNLFPRADWGHLVFVLPVAGVLLASATGAWLRFDERWRTALCAVGCAVLLGGALLASGALERSAGPPALGPRIAQRPVSPMYRGESLPRVVHFLERNAAPGEAIFVARAEPLLYHATGLRNPTPFGGVIPALRERQEEVLLRALEEIRFVVMSDLDRPIFNYYRDELPAVQRYLERHFRVARSFVGRNAGWILVLERGADRGPTHDDLYELRSEALHWVREGGKERNVPPPERLAVHQNRRPVAFRLGQDAGGIDYTLELPPQARFEASLGLIASVQGSRPVRHAMGSRWELSIRPEGAEHFRPLYSLDVRPGFAWKDLSVDLSEWAGQRVTLRLAVEGEFPLPPDSIGWWGSPRIVGAAAADRAATQTPSRSAGAAPRQAGLRPTTR